ncbi:hypothetical protein OUZ56_017211 [Daphnia magna]|uniref:Uncharacterized protein n=1 Tax=Daphnia magna TaxID=35525 RepID=A0ABR0ASV8_9CRUS|nr:hypothetical protein OUZ56_017211 [Daphnia magna]
MTRFKKSSSSEFIVFLLPDRINIKIRTSETSCDLDCPVVFDRGSSNGFATQEPTMACFFEPPPCYVLFFLTTFVTLRFCAEVNVEMGGVRSVGI